MAIGGILDNVDISTLVPRIKLGTSYRADEEDYDIMLFEEEAPRRTQPSDLERALRKADRTIEIIERFRKKDPSIREYSHIALILYFLRNEQANSRNILDIIRDEQRMRLAHRGGVVIPGYSDYQAAIDYIQERLGIPKRA